mmetsp:Transcript_6754/g.10866  ORF Transcript_6754/g.10866 Transcript_6754/m.10866 type:complete len:125 (+) Transcript_6754:817-1191(+)
MCRCPSRFTHAYCATAKVLRTKHIYCESCKHFYLMNLQKERAISPQTVRTLIKLTLLYIVIQVLILAIGKVDYFMKTNHIEEQGGELSQIENSEVTIDVQLSISLVIIWMWCVGLNLKNCINRN